MALQGDTTACDILRNIISERDSFISKSSVKYTYTHATSAIYLLGKLRDKDSIETLLDVIRDGGKFDTENFEANEFYATEDDMRFQYISHSIVALGKIAFKHPEYSQYIGKVLWKNYLLMTFLFSSA